MRLKLSAEFFKDKILNAPAGKLTTNGAFKEYFRGLYFKVENADGSAGSMAMLNFKAGKITIAYKAKTAITTDAEDVKEAKSIVLNLTGNTVSLLNNDFGSSGLAYNALPNKGNTTDGDGKLYLKGGEGSVTLIDLFGSTDVLTYTRSTGLITDGANGVPDELDNIKAKGWLINEASLTFYVDQNSMQDVADEPNRITLYDVNNKRQIIDYNYDVSTSVYPNYTKFVYGGILEKDSNKKGLKYKIRLTNHVRNIVNSDSTNVKLGVSVTQAISDVSFGRVRNIPTLAAFNALSAKDKNAFYFPLASVMNPFGIVLFGNNIPFGDPNYDKRLKLEIFYTKPN